MRTSAAAASAYRLAVRLMFMPEAKGVVGPAEGAGSRQMLPEQDE